MPVEHTLYSDGLVICGDSTSKEVADFASQTIQTQFSLIYTDPPYGRILNQTWDQTKLNQEQFVKWMFEWVDLWVNHLQDQAAFYIWGGIGKTGFRPFFLFLALLEYQALVKEQNKLILPASTPLTLVDLITWKKKRAIGTKKKYLFTREELVYLLKGTSDKPRVFNIPYLDKLRGYEGYNPKYPCKSPYLRRTNVWDDVTEIFRGKDHEAQKPTRLAEIVIEAHTNPGEYVLDIFAGSGGTGVAARKLGRKFVVIEQNPEDYNKIVEKLKV